MHKDTIKFLKQLQKNNSKKWFDEHRDTYQKCRTHWIDFASQILADLSLLDPVFIEQDPRKCIFRINRDIRFSRDKSPYKTNFGAHFVPGGKKNPRAGYYVHLEPGNCFIAGGIYRPASPELSKIRHTLDKKFKDFENLVTTKELEKTFGEIRHDSLTNPPRGYAKDHPGLKWLKMKGFIFIKNVDDNFYDQKNARAQIEADFKKLKPVIDFINKALND